MFESGEEQLGEEKVADVVRPDMDLVALFRERWRIPHCTGIKNQSI